MSDGDDIGDQVARIIASTDLRRVAAEDIELRRNGPNLVGLCPFHGEKTPSFYVYADHYHCFGCGVHGRIFDWLEKQRGMKFRDALEFLGGAPQQHQSHKPSDTKSDMNWRSIIPPAPEAAEPPEAMLAGFDAVHRYLDMHGLLFVIGRTEAHNGRRKQFTSIVYGELNGKLGWHNRHPLAPRPLYGLDRLAARPDAQVLLCEGEKSADAAQELFPARACMTWPGGANAVTHADFSPLSDRDVVIWPDNDEPGRKAAAEIVRRLPKARVLRVDDMPDGGDAADILPDDPEAWLREHLPAESPPKIAEFLSAEAWLERDFPEPERLLGDLIVAGVRMFVVGRTGLGKTMLGLAMAVAMASGQAFLHWSAGRPCRVLYIDGEMPGALIRQRLRDAMRRAGNPSLDGRLVIFGRDIEDEVAEKFPSLGKMPPLNTEAARIWLLALIDELGGMDAIFLDNVMSLLDGIKKEEENWSGALPLIEALSRRDIAQIWLDHTGHNSDRQYGTSTKSWRFDTVGLMTPLPDDDRAPGEMAFDLSFEPPNGKCRRRTPDNRDTYKDVRIRLADDRWLAEEIGRKPGGKGNDGLKPSRRPFYDALITAITKSSAGPGKTIVETWQLECLRRGLVEKPSAEGESHRQRSARWAAFRAAKHDLIAANWVAIEDDIASDLKGGWS